ncbi:MAG: L-histidine N(alpha)-methyltransferase [Acidobacteriota bacterium]|nr:L-histidine N(alpha)-methyltransferase [Acidobacteriota bacterium]
MGNEQWATGLRDPEPAAPSPALADFAQNVRLGLQRTPKQILPRYLYDELGSALFEAICRLPWYRVTRAEIGLLARHGTDVAACLQSPVTVVELGSGSGEKLLTLLEAMDLEPRPSDIHLIDVSAEALRLSAQALSRLRVSVSLHQTTYRAGLQQMAAARRPDGTMLGLFLGSNIGNFHPAEAQDLLRGIRGTLRPGDALLLGVDLVKPEADLLAAYDDPLGVTAAFNRNLLVRINRELGADFELGAFEHRAGWNAVASRVEMHLVSRRAQRVSIPGAGCVATFAAGETIWTESSYKYDRAGIAALVGPAGFRQREQWIDPDARFALTLFEAAGN